MFWGLELKANQAHQLTPGNALLTITNICLVAPGSVAVKAIAPGSVAVKAKGVTIAVLNDSVLSLLYHRNLKLDSSLSAPAIPPCKPQVPELFTYAATESQPTTTLKSLHRSLPSRS